jgi:hypothetical protein
MGKLSQGWPSRMATQASPLGGRFGKAVFFLGDEVEVEVSGWEEGR